MAVELAKAARWLAIGTAIFLACLGASLALQSCSIEGELACPDGEKTVWKSHGPFSAEAFCETPAQIEARAKADG